METLGIYSDVDSAAAAVDRLIAAGFPEERITSLTSVAYPNGVLVRTDERSSVRWFSLGGGIFGAIAGFALAAGTAWVYPVQTGDKAIVALFPTSIITYEFAMLCAILGTMVGMFLEMRLPPRQPRPYDRDISEGMIGLAVTAENTDEERRVAEVMKQAGALRVTAEAVL